MAPFGRGVAVVGLSKQRRPCGRATLGTSWECHKVRKRCPHCISGNAERMILFKIAFPAAKKGVLDCKNTCWQSRTFNLRSTSSFWQNSFCLSNWLFAIAAEYGAVSMF